MTQKKLLNRISPGYYTLSLSYNIYELANLIMTPSYITGNTALFLSGINFQYRTVIESASLLNYKKKIKGNEYLFRSMKKELLFNIQGILHNKLPAIACPERAILDLLYWNLLPDIDRPEKINLSLLTELSSLYPKTVQIKAKKIHG